MVNGGKENISVVVLNIYSPCQLNKKLEMWKEILHIKQLNNCKLWCMVGDFNSIRNQKERRGMTIGGSNSREVSEFNKFIDKSCVNDIPMVGRKYNGIDRMEHLKVA